MFTVKDISDYYDQTLPHYSIWWKLAEAHSLHYGYWDKNTVNLVESLQNMNKVMAETADIQSHHHVLDAGCGVGGAAFYLAKNIGCQVTGITLNKKQKQIADENCAKLQLEKLVNFDNQDYTKTNFPDNTFDVVWCCESVCHAYPKSAFVDEMSRILKKGGKVILADCFSTPEGLNDKSNCLKDFGDVWAVNEFNSKANLIDIIESKGFNNIRNIDISENVKPTINRIYLSYFLGFIPSWLYNLTHNTSRFAKTHYLTGKYQYIAFKKKFCTYNIVVATKL